MITTENQNELAAWITGEVGLAYTPDLRCIGSVIGGRVVGVVGYDNFNGASIMMHSAGKGYWLTPEMLWAVFDYPFNICKADVIIGMVPSGNAHAIRFNTHIGFKTELRLNGAHPDGALVIMTMRRRECRYLNLKDRRHGKELQAAASA